MFIPTFLINVGLILIIALRARVDLRENRMHLYYMWGMFLTVVMFVAKEYGFLKVISDFLFGNKVLYFTQALILLFILAHLSAFVHSLFIQFRKDMKKRNGSEETEKENSYKSQSGLKEKDLNPKKDLNENAINPKKNLKSQKKKK